MASPAIRDQRANEKKPAPKVIDLPEQQIPIRAKDQRLLVSIVESDIDHSVKGRLQTEWGKDAKGTQYDHDGWLKELTDLYLGHRLAKTVPWRFSSNRSMMIAMAIVEVLHSRFMPAVYNEELTKWRPTERNDAERAERVEKFMFWWIRVRAKMRDFFDRWTRYFIGYGTVWTESHFEVEELDKGGNERDTPIKDEQGQPVLGPDGQPSAVPGARITQSFEKTRSELIPLEDVFVPSGNYDIQKDPIIFRKKWLFRELEDMERAGDAINVTVPVVPGTKTLFDLLPLAPHCRCL